MGCCGGKTAQVHPPEGERRPPLPEHMQTENFSGPLEERSCRDVIFLVLFLAFLGGLGYGLAYAVVRGDVRRVLQGYDSKGDLCGVKNTPLKNITGSGKDLTNLLYLVPDYLAGGVTVVNWQDPISLDPFLQLGARKRTCQASCPSNTQAFLKRCLPTNATSQAAVGVLRSTGIADFFQEASLDLQLCWKEILYLALISLCVALAVSLLFRFLAGVVIWFIMCAVVLGSLAGTAYLWFTWHLMKKGMSSQSTPSDKAKTDVRNMMIYAIIMSVVSLVLILIILVLRKRIQLAIQLFHEAGKAIQAMPLLLIQPLWTFICLLLICVGWAWGVVWIESAGTPTADAEGYVSFVKDNFLKLVRWYHVMALLWTTQFCIACQHVVVAGAVSTWFFSRTKNKLGMPVLKAVGRLIRYHLGSVALGSFVIALFKLIRLIISYIERRMKASTGGNTMSACCSFCLKCCQCCLFCFEKFLVYLNTNAYIEIAIYGKNFCRSAHRAFTLLVSNALRVAMINSVGDFVLFLGKAAIVTAVVFIGIEIIKPKPGVHHLWVPVLVAALFSYIIAHCFISIYEMCIDTIFLCFCEDCEMNDGINRPYFMSRGLMEFVENSKKALEALGERQRQAALPKPQVWTTANG